MEDLPKFREQLQQGSIKQNVLMSKQQNTIDPRDYAKARATYHFHQNPHFKDVIKALKVGNQEMGQDISSGKLQMFDCIPLGLRPDITPGEMIQEIILNHNHPGRDIKRALQIKKDSVQFYSKVIEALSKWQKPPMMMTDQEKNSINDIILQIEKEDEIKKLRAPTRKIDWLEIRRA